MNVDSDSELDEEDDNPQATEEEAAEMLRSLGWQVDIKIIKYIMYYLRFLLQEYGLAITEDFASSYILILLSYERNDISEALLNSNKF